MPPRDRPGGAGGRMRQAQHVREHDVQQTIERERVRRQRAGVLLHEHHEALGEVGGAQRLVRELERGGVLEQRADARRPSGDLAREVVGHRHHEALRAGVEVERVHGARRHHDQRGRGIFDGGAFGVRHAAAAHHEDQLMQRAVHVRPDLPAMTRAAELDRLDVQHPLVVAARRLAVERETRYACLGYRCCCHACFPRPPTATGDERP